MSAASDAREALEAAVRQQATYLEPHTGRYRCAVSEAGMTLILAAADAHAETVALAAISDDGRRKRLADAEASAAEHRGRLEAATAERTGRTG